MNTEQKWGTKPEKCACMCWQENEYLLVLSGKCIYECCTLKLIGIPPGRTMFPTVPGGNCIVKLLFSETVNWIDADWYVAGGAVEGTLAADGCLVGRVESGEVSERVRARFEPEPDWERVTGGSCRWGVVRKGTDVFEWTAFATCSRTSESWGLLYVVLQYSFPPVLCLWPRERIWTEAGKRDMFKIYVWHFLTDPLVKCPLGNVGSIVCSMLAYVETTPRQKWSPCGFLWKNTTEKGVASSLGIRNNLSFLWKSLYLLTTITFRKSTASLDTISMFCFVIKL